MLRTGQALIVYQVPAVPVAILRIGVQVVLAKAFPAVLALIPVQVKA
jgi:hypothetical protein